MRAGKKTLDKMFDTIQLGWCPLAKEIYESFDNKYIRSVFGYDIKRKSWRLFVSKDSDVKEFKILCYCRFYEDKDGSWLDLDQLASDVMEYIYKNYRR